MHYIYYFWLIFVTIYLIFVTICLIFASVCLIFVTICLIFVTVRVRNGMRDIGRICERMLEYGREWLEY